jgi:hypothetical protein
MAADRIGSLTSLWDIARLGLFPACRDLPPAVFSAPGMELTGMITPPSGGEGSVTTVVLQAEEAPSGKDDASNSQYYIM